MTLEQAWEKYGLTEAEFEMMQERAAIIMESDGLSAEDADYLAIQMALQSQWEQRWKVSAEEADLKAQ